jgi:hypothetical protein
VMVWVHSAESRAYSLTFSPDRKAHPTSPTRMAEPLPQLFCLRYAATSFSLRNNLCIEYVILCLC